jgi:ABC-type ATPase involved in cell division
MLDRAGELARRTARRARAGDRRRPHVLLVDEPEGGLDEESLAAWRTCMVRALEGGDTALVVATHAPVAFNGMPVREIRLSPNRT